MNDTLKEKLVDLIIGWDFNKTKVKDVYRDHTKMIHMLDDKIHIYIEGSNTHFHRHRIILNIPIIKDMEDEKFVRNIMDPLLESIVLYYIYIYASAVSFCSSLSEEKRKEEFIPEFGCLLMFYPFIVDGKLILKSKYDTNENSPQIIIDLKDGNIDDKNMCSDDEIEEFAKEHGFFNKLISF